MNEKTVLWNLSELYHDDNDAKIEEDCQSITEDSQSFASLYKNKVASLDADEVKKAIKTLEQLYEKNYKLLQYANLRFSENTKNHTVKSLLAKVEDLFTSTINTVLFFNLELSKLKKEQIEHYCSKDTLSQYRYFLTRLHDCAIYNLSEKEEQLCKIKNVTGSDALKQLYEEITTDFKFEITIDGETKTLNDSGIRNLRLHPDKNVRETAMKVFFSKYETNKILFASLYNNVVKSLNMEASIRGYRSTLQQKNIINDLDDKMIETLHDVTDSSTHLVQRYYKLKSKLLGNIPLRLSDIYAPIPDSDASYTWEESIQTVLDSFQAFDTEFYTIAKRLLDEKHVHAPILTGKTGGAFCSGYVPNQLPYVLVNFFGKLRDITTIAHEFGHAIHYALSEKQSLFNLRPILPLAETASVFCEKIVMESLKNQMTRKKDKINILVNTLEDIFAVSFRQNLFSRFEIEAHRRIQQGELLSAEALCSIYKQGLEKLFGDSIMITDEFHWGWATIPHIYQSPFYVYAYNFGNLLVLSLYQNYIQEGKTFIPRLKTFLSLGSSESPKTIAEKMGIDLSDRCFWENSMRYIESLLEELELLVATE